MKSSSGDESEKHPYLRDQFYTIIKLSERQGITPLGRKYFARKEKEESDRIRKFRKEDLI